MIRTYAPSDRSLCLALFEFARFLDTQTDRYFVLDDVACGGWGDRDGVALLCWGMVRRDRHRSGLGSQLLEHRLAAIAAAGFTTVEITTSQYSAPFFARHGFVEIEVRRDEFASGLHAHQMRRAL